MRKPWSLISRFLILVVWFVALPPLLAENIGEHRPGAIEGEYLVLWDVPPGKFSGQFSNHCQKARRRL